MALSSSPRSRLADQLRAPLDVADYLVKPFPLTRPLASLERLAATPSP